jgi:hypothetical protein
LAVILYSGSSAKLVWGKREGYDEIRAMTPKIGPSRG